MPESLERESIALLGGSLAVGAMPGSQDCDAAARSEPPTLRWEAAGQIPASPTEDCDRTAAGFRASPAAWPGSGRVT
jgi:hypothetical protein